MPKIITMGVGVSQKMDLIDKKIFMTKQEYLLTDSQKKNRAIGGFCMVCGGPTILLQLGPRLLTDRERKTKEAKKINGTCKD